MNWKFFSLALCHISLFALPQNPSVQQGKAVMHRGGGNANIICDDRTIIHWDSFSIAENEALNFLQKNSSSSVLNRVMGGDISQILGTLHANGNIFLINSNGIVIGPNAEIMAASLCLSTLDILDEDFLEGNKLTLFGSEEGEIQHFGKLIAKEGDLLLFAGKIENKGTIEAPNGTFSSGVGEMIVLEKGKHPKTFFQVSGKKEELLLHRGKITAKKMDSISSGSLIMDGEFTATEKEGRVYLLAKDDLLHIDGYIKSEGAEGYFLGKDVQLGPAAYVDVSGEKAGKILVGGGVRGKDPDLQNALTTHIDFGSVLKADGIGEADGGSVHIWGDRLAAFHGDISVRGGEIGGDGGLAEVSGEGVSFQGQADCRAPNGVMGDFVLDPKNMNIVPPGTATFSLTAATLTFNNPTAAFDPLLVSNTSIETQLGMGNVTLQANNAITVDTNITAGAGDNGNLTMQAGADIILTGGVIITLVQDMNSGGNFHGTVNDGGGTAAQRDSPGDPGMFVMNANSSIVTNGGNITIDTGNFGGSQNGIFEMGSSSSLNATGGNGGTITIDMQSTAAQDAIALTDATIQTDGTGNIDIDSQLAATAGNAFRMDGTTIQSDGGTIDIMGAVSSITGSQRGVYIRNSTNNITSGNGNISITGTSAGSGSSTAHGIDFGSAIGSTSQVQSTGSGSIMLTGSSQSASAAGTLIDREGTLQTASGDITVMGTSTNGTGISSNTDIMTTGGSITLTGMSSIGGAVELNPFGLITSSADDKMITINGTVTSGGGTGVNITGQNVTSSSANANASPIMITGTAGTAGSSTGFRLREFNGTAAITANAANITIMGTGRGTAGSVGCIFIDGEVGTPGNISITGIGSSSGTDGSHGIQIFTGDTPITSTGGSISMTGTAGTGDSDGIIFPSGWTGMVNADTTLMVEGSGSSGGVGINVLGGTLQCQDNLTLMASTTTSSDNAIVIGATVQCTGTGDVSATVTNGGLAMAENGILQTTGTGSLECDVNNNIFLISGANNATISINNGGSSANMLLKAGQNIAFLSPGAGNATATNTGSGNITLVCDNLFPSPPGFGSSGFVFNSTITTNGELRIYTVSPMLNTITDPLNGQNFVPGAFGVDSTTEQYGVYFPGGTYGGEQFNLYYKVTASEAQDVGVEEQVIYQVAVTQTQLTDLLPTIYNNSMMQICEQEGNISNCMQDPFKHFIRRPFFRRSKNSF